MTRSLTWHQTTAALSASQLVAWGVLHYSFAVYLPQMRTDLGWSLATLSGGFATATVVAGVAAPLVGRWIDLRGSRSIMSVGTLVGLVGLTLWVSAHHIAIFYLAFLLIGIAMSTTLYAPAFATVVQHHPGHSKQAIVVITLAGGFASTIFSPLAQLLSEQGSWRTGLAVLTLGYALISFPLNLTLPRGRPQLMVDGTADKPQISPESRPRALWLLAAIFTLSAGVSAAFSVHIVAFLIESGQTATIAASIAGAAGLGKVSGRALLVAGIRYSPISVLKACLLIQATVLTLPLVWPGLVGALFMVVMFGATSGALTILRPILVADLVGNARFGHRNGEIQLVTTLTKATTPVAVSVAVGFTSYALTWMSLTCLAIAATAVAARLRLLPDRSVLAK